MKTVPAFKAPQFARMILILSWLRDKRLFNANAVVDFYGDVSVRTVKSDIENLRVLGYDVEYNYTRKSFVLMDDSGDLPLPQIRRAELAVLQLAQHMFESIGAQPLADTTDEFVNRVQELMPVLTGMDISSLSPSLTVLRGPHAEVSFPFWNELNEAIINTESVDIEYFTMSRNETTRRLVDPYRLVSAEGHSYMIAHCHNRKRILFFRLDRVRSLAAANCYFDIPSDFDEKALLAPMFGIFHDGKPFKVKVRFSSWVARWIREDRWHTSQTFTDLPDGSLQLDMEVTGTVDVKRWILSFGKDAEVLEPEHLRQAIAAEAEEMLKTYG
jgi:predicted DNA-binding transcriptional regulator YafY